MAILCFLALCANLKAESVFSLDLKTDIVLGTLAIGVSVSSLFIETRPDRIPDSLGRGDVNAFDRALMVTRQNTAVKRVSDVAIVGLGLLPVLSFADNFTARTVVTYGVMYSQAMLLAYGSRMLLKNNVTRFRPYLHDGRELRPDHRTDSFPSGHTCVAFLSATFFSTTFFMERPDSRWRWPVAVGSHLLAAGVGVMRMIAGMHFLSDVLVGAAMGSLYGWLVPFLHGNRDVRDFPVKVTGNGLLVSLRL